MSCLFCPGAAWSGEIYLDTMDTDQGLLEQYVRQGDQNAFGQLVERYSSLVFSVCLRRLGNASEADDASQAVFLILSRRAGSLLQRAWLSRPVIADWLHRTAHFVALKNRRQSVRRQRREQEAAVARSKHSEEADAAGVEAEPRSVDHAVAKLPTRYRQVVVLHFLAGKARAAVAEELSITIAAVDKRLQRAIALLRSSLRDRSGGAATPTAITAILAGLTTASSANAADMAQSLKNFLSGETVPKSILNHVTAFSQAATAKVLLIAPALVAVLALSIAAGIFFRGTAAAATAATPPAKADKLPAYVPKPGEIANVNLNTLADVNPCPAGDCGYFKVSNGFPGIFDWTGGIYAEHAGKLGSLVFFGTGHSSNFINCGFRFDLAERKWHRMKDPFPATYQSNADLAGNWEGKLGECAVGHTYNHQRYLPPALGGGKMGSLLLLTMGAVDNNAGMRFYGHRFDIETEKWSLYVGPPPDPNVRPHQQEIPTCFDSKRNFFWMVTKTGQFCSSLDPKSQPAGNPPLRSWVSYACTTHPNFEYGAVGDYCPPLDCMIILDTHLGKWAKLWALDLTTFAWTDCGTIPSGWEFRAGPSISWCPKLGKHAVYFSTGSKEIFWATPPKAKGGAWTWTREEFTGEKPAFAVGVSSAGLPQSYGRFAWIPALESFGWYDGINSPVQLWRPSDK
jgi:RNA polymerase sigma factor (sigma-70 family)